MSADDDSVELVCFRAAGWWVAVPASEIRASHPWIEGDPPGLAVADWLGLDQGEGPAPGGPVMGLERRADGLRLRVNGPVNLLRLPLDVLHPLPDLVAACHGLPVWHGVALHDGQVYLLSSLAGAEAPPGPMR